jgi:integrase
MAVVSLTQKLVDNLVCPTNKNKEQYRDKQTKGLVVEVWATGHKSYLLNYRDNRSKQRYAKLGDTNVINLSQARQLASKYMAQIAMGEDPFAKKAELKQVPTLAAFIADSYMPHIKTYKRSWSTDASLIKNHILPAFGAKYMDEITKRDFIAFIGQHRTDHAPGSVNRVIILLRYIFNCAIRWETVGVKVNPTAGIPLLEENNKKERFLSAEEAQALFSAVQQSDNSMLQYIIPMLLLTGTRKREVLDAKWSDFDFTRRIWRISMSKSGKARHVPMSDGVIMLLKSVPRIESILNNATFPDTQFS